MSRPVHLCPCGLGGGMHLAETAFWKEVLVGLEGNETSSIGEKSFNKDPENIVIWTCHRGWCQESLYGTSEARLLAPGTKLVHVCHCQL